MRAVSSAFKLAGAQRGESEGEETSGYQFVSAFGEAFNNAVQHGYSHAPRPGHLQIEVSWDTETITVKLIDEAASFDPSVVPPPELDSLPESGMGLFIIRSFVDRFDYKPGPPNVLSLTKRLPGR